MKQKHRGKSRWACCFRVHKPLWSEKSFSAECGCDQHTDPLRGMECLGCSAIIPTFLWQWPRWGPYFALEQALDVRLFHQVIKQECGEQKANLQEKFRNSFITPHLPRPRIILSQWHRTGKFAVALWGGHAARIRRNQYQKIRSPGRKRATQAECKLRYMMAWVIWILSGFVDCLQGISSGWVCLIYT